MKVSKIKNKENFLKKNFKSALSYIKKNSFYVNLSIFFFLIFILVGFFYPSILEKEIKETIEKIVEKSSNLDFYGLFLFITGNNIKTAFLGLFLGIFFGVYPAIILFFNAYLIGFVLNKLFLSNEILSLWKLIPHGIFEIPAFIISVSIGLRLGVLLFETKRKFKSLIALGLFFLIFILSLNFVFSVLFLLKNPYLLNNINALTKDSIKIFYESLFEDNLLSLLFFIIIMLCFVFSFRLSVNVLTLEDKKIISENMENSIKVFIFFILPLLLIAGLIESLLIIFLR